MSARTAGKSVIGAALGIICIATVVATCSPRGAERDETVVKALKGAGAPPNFKIGPPHYENTAAVAPPSASCPLGTIMVNLGGDGIYTRPIYKTDGTIDTTPNLPITAWPLAAQTVAGVDDNIVRLNDGTFLAEAHGGIWSAFPGTPPVWANEFISGQVGNRWAAHFVKGDSCGANWQLSTPLDIAAIGGGKYALPRPSADADANDIPQKPDVACKDQTNDSHGRPLWWIGGGDRPEVYNDPYTGNVYMTFHGISGPYCPVKDEPAFGFGVVVVSRDKGQTWEFLAEIANVPPMVMTSTPDGRLYLAALNWTEVWLYYTKPTAPGQLPEFVAPPTSPCGLDACPFIVNQLDSMGMPIPNQLGVGEDIHRFENNIQISRISNDRASSKIRVAYQDKNPTSSMQQQRVVRVEIPPEGGLPLVKPVTLVDAFDPQDHSVIYFNFNDSDVPSTPAGTKSNTSMAYWYEAPRCREGELQDGYRRCHIVNADSKKCGTANTVCAAGQVCAAGSCVASCPTGTTQCADPFPGGVGCFDTTTSTRNCGGCGNTCAFGQTCAAGKCTNTGGTGKPAYGLRHMFFDGDCRVTRPRFLSVDDKGAARNFEGTNLAPGDYQKGASFWKGSQLNYFAQWSEFDFLYGAVTTSPFTTSQGDAHAWTHDRTQADFTPWDTMVRADGWKTVDLRSFVSPSGEILVDGVWHKQSAATVWIEGYLYSDYLTALANYKAQGYRLEKLQSFPLNDGTFRVDALFQQNSNVDNALAAQGYSPADFVALDTARTAAGDRLDHIGSWIVSDGTVRVDGVWHHDPGASYFVQGYTVADFQTAHAQRQALGYRLDELASFYIPGQGVRVDALWHPGPEQAFGVQGYSVDDFRSVESDLRCQGFQLQKVSSFVIPGEGIRMDGVWHRAAAPAPTALCQDASVVAGPTCSGTVTVDMIDNGSFDASGGAPALTLSNTTFTGVGPHTVTLTATSGGQSSSCTATVTIVDGTPPTITAPAAVSTTQCLGSGTVALGSPTASDNCLHPPTITGRVVSVNGVAVSSPSFTGSSTTLGVGTSVIEWTASDGPNSVTATQTVTVGTRIESSFSFLVDDRAHVNGPGTSLAAIANAGTGTTRVGFDAFTGGITSVSGATVLDRATIGGNILSAGMNNVSGAANVSGTVTNFGVVSLPPLPTLPSFPPVTGGSLTVSSGTFTRGPGSYDTFQLNGGTLTLTGAGDYYFRSLTINNGATIRVAANARVFVLNTLVYHARFLQPTGTNTQTVTLGYAGSGSVSMEAPFNGTLVAPAASVGFGTGSGLTFTGSFFARTIEVKPASTLVCQ